MDTAVFVTSARAALSVVFRALKTAVRRWRAATWVGVGARVMVEFLGSARLCKRSLFLFESHALCYC